MRIFPVITRSLNRIIQIPLVRRLSPTIKRLTPRPARDFLRALKFELPLIDHSTVILFADDDFLPTYTPRHPLHLTPGEIPSDIKVSLIATVFNEAHNIRQWFDSILAGCRRPDEIVILDAGSTDDTLEIIQGIAFIRRWTFRSSRSLVQTSPGSQHRHPACISPDRRLLGSGLSAG
jgi:hypothetical protein